MPTITYFRLEKEKQDKIMEAAKKEFSIVSIQEASIANIIKYAEIPRGSFYQYFSGKDDLFFYLFSLIRKKPEEVFLSLLEETNGDLFETFKQFFVYFMTEVVEGENKELFKNIFQHMNYTRSNRIMTAERSSEERKYHESHVKIHHHEVHERVTKLINQDKLRIKNDREFQLLIHQLWSMLFHTVNEGFRLQLVGEQRDNQLLQNDFEMKIKWLQYGVSY